jgi:hypothetical protein
MDLNILVRGQSNALLFVQNGGAARMEAELERSFGTQVDIRILASWGTGKEHSIHSGTAFLDWDTSGLTAGMASFLDKQPETVKDDPTITVWMHNEYDANTLGVTTGQWAQEVTADAAIMRGELNQQAGTTPYLFTWIPYPYTKGDSPAAIKAGMTQLAADPGFNAKVGPSLDDLAMDGDGYARSSHMGTADALLTGSRLANALTTTVAQLTGSSVVPPSATPAPTPTLGSFSAGTGPDALVLKVSQDAWQAAAQYRVKVDGVQIGGTFSVTANALHKQGLADTLTLKGDWAAGSHQVEVTFLNDGWGGSAATDRNLYVESATYNGAAVTGAPNFFYSSGAKTFSFTEAALPENAPATITDYIG